MIKKLEDLRFNLSQEMYDILFSIILIKQMLKSDKLNKEQKEPLEKEFEDLKREFIKNFSKLNKEEIKIYKELIEK